LQTVSEKDWERPSLEWLGEIERLVEQVESWSAELGWETARGITRSGGDTNHEYEAPSLRVTAPFGTLIFEPKLAPVLGALGRVDLVSYPRMDRVMLLRTGDLWKIRGELGPTIPLPWNKETFVELSRALVGG
jgi:hypothetical protein